MILGLLAPGFFLLIKYPTVEQSSLFTPPLQFLAHGPNLKGVIVPRPLAASQSMHQHHTSDLWNATL